MENQNQEFVEKLLRAVQYRKDLQIMPENRILQKHFDDAATDVINVLTRDKDLKLMNLIINKIMEK